MSEERLSSKKLDIEGATRLSAGEEKLKESYRPISEDISLSHVTGDTVKNSNMVRENGDSVQDGADEKMLGSAEDKETLALKNVEVKFVSGDQNLNGDAKIDIGNGNGVGEKTFTGMTKEELMKYANDPFWVRLRWVLFILFWGLWIAMLLGAIAIIVYAPKCAAPTPLVWWKKGPLITIDGNESEARIKEIKDFNAKGVVYELSNEETYFVDTALIEERIKKLVKEYEANDIHLVLDLTANYVTRDDKLFKDATATVPDAAALSAFVTTSGINNWLKVGDTRAAWKLEGRTYFLSQFNDFIDLQFSSPVAQQKLTDVLVHLAGLGVKGFRLNNAKHFIINPELKDEQPNREPSGKGVGEYGFYNHFGTTYQEQLGPLLHKFSMAVHNATMGEGFLTIRDDSAERAEVWKASESAKHFGFDLPHFVFLRHLLNLSSADIPKRLFMGFDNLKGTIDLQTLWMQETYKPDYFNHNLDRTAYIMFMSFLRGVQLVPLESLKADGDNKTTDVIRELEKFRESPVFQHGNFDYFLSNNETAFAYTRIKSGMPGYLVALNPTDVDVIANFTSDTIGAELSVQMLSPGFDKNPLRGKVLPNSVPLPRKSVAIFTFVPK